MIRINIRQVRRGCGCGQSHFPASLLLFTVALMFATIVTVPGLFLWAIPMAVVSSVLTLFVIGLTCTVAWLLAARRR